MMLRLRRTHGGPTLTGLSSSSHRPWETFDGRDADGQTASSNARTRSSISSPLQSISWAKRGRALAPDQLSL
jgi:hypothetical protein